MKDLTADIASVDIHKAAVDTEGAIWVRNRQLWTYVTDHGLADDAREALPVEYEPYRPLDYPASVLVLNALRVYPFTEDDEE